MQDSSQSENGSSPKNTQPRLPHNQAFREPEDELDYCQKPNQINTIKQRIYQMDRQKEDIQKRKQKRLEQRRAQINDRDSSLSISQNGSAISAVFSNMSALTGFQSQIDQYASIAQITESQNTNLKNQNQYLLAKLKKMKQKEAKFAKIVEKAKKYKTLYEETMRQLEITREEKQAYRKMAEQMKEIALVDVNRLQNKLNPYMHSLDDSGSVQSEKISKIETSSGNQETTVRNCLSEYI